MNYHIARNGQQLGNYPKDEALARYQRAEILPTDLVWCEGMTGWQPADSVFGPAAVPPAISASNVPPPPPPPPPAPTYRNIGVAPVAGGQPPKPDNFLVWSILVTFLCCLPGGIAAIIYATQVDSKYNAGDFAGAQAAAKNAKMWTLISVGVGLLFSLCYGVFIALNVAGAMGGMH